MSRDIPAENRDERTSSFGSARSGRFDRAALADHLSELLCAWTEEAEREAARADGLAWQAAVSAGRLFELAPERLSSTACPPDTLIERALEQTNPSALRRRFAALERRSDELEAAEERRLFARSDPQLTRDDDDEDDGTPSTESEIDELEDHVRSLAETWVLERDAHEDLLLGLRAWSAHDKERFRARYVEARATTSALDLEVQDRIELLFPAIDLCRAHKAAWEQTLNDALPQRKAERWWWTLPVERFERLENATRLEEILPAIPLPVSATPLVIVSFSLRPWLEKAGLSYRLAAATGDQTGLDPATLSERLRAYYEPIALPEGRRGYARLTFTDDGRLVILTVLDEEKRPTGCLDGFKATLRFEADARAREATIEDGQARIRLEAGDIERLASASLRIEPEKR